MNKLFTRHWAFERDHITDYMNRWIFKHPWGTIRIHHILRSDNQRDLHDHPFDFTSFLLTGGYTEVTYFHQERGRGVIFNGENYHTHWKQFDIVRRKAEDCHRLILEKPIWTLVFTGPYKRLWGFQTKTGWVLYTAYRQHA